MSINILTGITLILALAGSATAANLVVYNTNNVGAGSFRQAIADNAALGGGNTIIFSNAVAGTITLSTGELFISNDVTIIGPGPKVLAVDGNAASRIFHITNSTVVISGLTITNGSAGGGVLGGGMFNNHSTLTISNCNITGNTADGGGGVASRNFKGRTALLSLIASTISSNYAAFYGGGIFIFGEPSATSTVVACTLTDNYAVNGGGGIASGAGGRVVLTVIASTFSSNATAGVGFGGGGILNHTDNLDPTTAILEIGNCILKAGASGPNLANSSGTIISQGYNISSDDGGGHLTAIGDQITTDPMLGPLQDNGGPTFTHALKVGSPAIDGGKSFSLSADQRGSPRTYDNPNIANATGGDGTDVGAYEASELRIVGIQTTGDHLQLDFTSWLGANYEVQSRSNMLAGSWEPLPGSTPGNGGVASTTVSNALDQPKRFYRIHPVP